MALSHHSTRLSASRAGCGGSPAADAPHDSSRLSRSGLYGDLLHRSGVEYATAIGVRTERGQVVVAGLGRADRQFSGRDRDVLGLVSPPASRTPCGPPTRIAASSRRPPPPRRRGTAVVLLDRYGETEHFEPGPRALARRHFGPREPRGRNQSSGGSRCRRARRWSASTPAGASRSAWCPAIRTLCCSRRPWRASARTPSTGSA